MPFCMQCGKNIEEGLKFCTGCGAPVVPLEDEITVELPKNFSVESTNSPSSDGVSSNQQTPSAKRKRKKAPIIVAVGALALIAVAGIAVFAMPESIDTPLKKEGASAVRYSSNEQAAVTPSTSITIHGKDDKPLSDYDLLVMDEEGNVSSHHVDGDSFMPSDLGIEEGAYSITAKTTSGEIVNIPDVVVGPNDGDSEKSKKNDVIIGATTNASEGNIESKVESTNVRQLAFGAYFDKTKELQSAYGEAVLNADGTALEGLCFTKLIDFNDDGIEELVTVCSDGIENSYALTSDFEAKVWSYDEKNNKLSEEYSGPVGGTNGGWVFLNVIDVEEKKYLASVEYTSSDDYSNYATIWEFFGVNEDGDFSTWNFEHRYSETSGRSAGEGQSECLLNGKKMGEREFQNRLDYFGNHYMEGSFYLLIPAWEDDSLTNYYETYEEVMVATDETINALKEGMMGNFEVEMSEKNSPKSEGSNSDEGVSSGEPEESNTSDESELESNVDDSAVVMVSADASSVLTPDNSAYSPMNVLDGDISTCWSEGAQGEGLSESITLYGDSIQVISGFTISSGFQETEELYYANARPQRIDVYARDTRIGMFTLADDGCIEQTFTFSAPVETSELTFCVMRAYSGTTWDDCCISEIRVF